MRIGLIDVDGHRFPNLALMRISAYHKALGDQVEWWWSDFIHYDRVYMSKVFSASYSQEIPEPMNADLVIKGGTGYAISIDGGVERFDESKHKELPAEIEAMPPDYSIYPQYNFAVSMTSRGCPRNCHFCHVTQKEGRWSVKVADVNKFWQGQKEIKVLDANITACRNKGDLLDQYARTGAEINYTQGLDIRFLTDGDIEILNRTNLKNAHFAWDNPKDDLKELFKWYAAKAKNKPKGSYGTVYVLTNFDSTIEEDLYRIETLRSLNYDPYVMIYDKPNAPNEIKHLQRWCNAKPIFKTCSFADYRRREA